MGANRVATLAFGFAVTLALGADTPPHLDALDTTVLNIRLSAVVLTTFGEQGGRFPPPYPRLATLESLAPSLGFELRGNLALEDGWGRSLEILITDSPASTLISFGADGMPDVPYTEIWENDEHRPDGPRLDPSSLDRDIVFGGGEFLQRPQAPESASKRSLADLRTIATAIESFAVDNNVYPGPTSGLKSIDVLAGDLEGIYIRKLPREDPWGHPYLVWSDDTSYLLVGAGSDGKLDREYPDVKSVLAGLGEPQSTTDEDADVVFVDGEFVRSPAAGR